MEKFSNEELYLIRMYMDLQERNPMLFEKVKNRLLETLKIEKNGKKKSVHSGRNDQVKE